MIKNYLKAALRNIWKDKLHAFINITGLSLGMMVAILILAYTQYEMQVDHSIPEHEQISRVYRQWEKSKMLVNPQPLAGALREELDAVASATNLQTVGEQLILVEDESFTIENVLVADAAFFDVFEWPFDHGKRENAFDQLNTIVLSQRVAQRLFGTDNPLGQLINFNNETLCKVTGVLTPFEGDTHLDFDMIVHIKGWDSSWTGAAGVVYVRHSPNTGIADIENGIAQVANKYIKQDYLASGKKEDEIRLPEWKLQPMDKVHLYSYDIRANFFPGGDIRQVRLLAGLALLVLLLAGINYVNLATARSGKRTKEVGMRKVLGASRGQLRTQFFVESILQAFVAMVIAVVLAELLIPFFNQLIDRDLSLLSFVNTPFPLYLLLLALTTGLLAGVYPALVLERLKPIFTIQGNALKGRSGSTFRKGLVIFQFTLSTALIIFIAVVWQQLQYLYTQELGFNGEQVIVVDIHSEEGVEKIKTKKDILLEVPGIKSVSNLDRVPGDFIPDYSMDLETEEEEISAMLMFSDENFAEVLELEVIDGRFFDKQHPTDSTASFVVNQSFVDAFGLNPAIGKRIRFPYEGESYGQIIGVVKDFHYNSLEREVNPAVISMRDDIGWLGKVAVKFDSKDVASVLSGIENFWKDFEPIHPFKYTFLDDHFVAQYDRYLRLQKTIFYASIISILVALLGLFGLASFMAEQRTKEISIRKILGASVQQLVYLLVNSLLRLVLVAGLLSFPIAFYFANKWLQNFAFKISLGPVLFVFVLVGILLLALLTVGVKALVVAQDDPVKHLKQE